MDTLKAMEMFASVAKARSFAVAADQLGVSPSAVTKHVMQLESHLGVRLINRTTRQVGLTETGRDYNEFCIRFLADLREKEETLAQENGEARGTLKMLAPKSFGSLHLGKIVSDFTSSNPEISVSLFLSDASLGAFDFVESGFDLALRLTAPSESSLTVRRIGTARWVLCASPRALKDRGVPRSPKDLASYPILLHSRSRALDPSATWRLTNAGRTTPVAVTGSITSNSVMVLCAAAVEGKGIALLPTYCLGDDIESGRLVQILERYRVPDEEISILFPHRTLLPAKSRLFIDFMAERLQVPPWE
jgi:DNA-binding transcriptional LysR family regulator